MSLDVYTYYQTCRCVCTCVQRSRSWRTAAGCWQGLKELSCGVRVKGLPGFSEFFSRVFLFYSEKLFMCYFYSVNFLLKTSSGFICKRVERERICLSSVWSSKDTEETSSHVNTYPHTPMRACVTNLNEKRSFKIFYIGFSFICFITVSVNIELIWLQMKFFYLHVSQKYCKNQHSKLFITCHTNKKLNIFTKQK